MGTNSNKNIEDQEIDLAQISEKIGGIFQRLNTLLFKSIRFAVKNIVIIAILLIIGHLHIFYCANKYSRGCYFY